MKICKMLFEMYTHTFTVMYHKVVHVIKHFHFQSPHPGTFLLPQSLYFLATNLLNFDQILTAIILTIIHLQSTENTYAHLTCYNVVKFLSSKETTRLINRSDSRFSFSP